MSRPVLQKSALLTILSTYVQYDRIPVDWDLAEGYARRALEMAGKLDAALALSMALGTLARHCILIAGFGVSSCRSACSGWRSAAILASITCRSGSRP